MSEPRYMHEASTQELTEELGRRSRSCVVGLTGIGDRTTEYVLYHNGHVMETLGLAHAIAAEMQRVIDTSEEEA